MSSLEISLDQPRLAFSGESKYLPKLQVFGNQDPKVNDLELGADNLNRNYQKFDLRANKIDSNPRRLQDKISTALKLLTFREQHVLVQFWWPHMVANHQLLTTLDQPFGLGVDNERLWSYRRESEANTFLADKDREDQDCSPAARVFRRGLPEWTCDLNNYTPKQFPLQERATRSNLHGYVALPVFDSTTWLCVGVLELLTTSKCTSYAYEVQQVHKALETVELGTHKTFECYTLNVGNDCRRKDLDRICGILKTMCDKHSLPLAQTWAVSPHTSFVAHEKVIQQSCSSFNTRCVGKVCMSTTALPFHVKDLRMWSFWKTCRVQHLHTSSGLVGKALSSRGSSFCEDVTKLSEEEYPLVHNARINKLTSCFAIFLHNVETNDDYALEFFLPSDNKDNNKQVLILVETLKNNLEIGSAFELGDTSCIHIVGPPTEVGNSLSTDPQAVQISSITTNKNKVETVTSDSESVMVTIANKTESNENMSNQLESKQIYPVDDVTQHEVNVVDARQKNKTISYPSVSMQNMSDNMSDKGDIKKRLKQGRKRKIDLLTMEAVEEHVDKTIEQAAKNLGVSRSTLKRFCRDNNMPSWPLPKHSKNAVPVTSIKLSPKKNLQRDPNNHFGLAFVVLLVVRVKRWKSKSSMRNHLTVNENTAKPKYTIGMIDTYLRDAELSPVRASPKDIVEYDIKMVTVKTTFKNDMIKFQFPTSSSLLELEREVVRRIKFKSREFRLKYKDEDDDLILIACDADLHNLLRFADNHSTIKLIIPDD